MVGAKVHYSSMAKICLPLVFVIQKLRHYLVSHHITAISKADPLRYILSKPLLPGRLAKWDMLLALFDIKFVPQKAVKGQVIADFLAAYPCPDNEELPNNMPDEEVMLVETKSWQLYFYGVARNRGAGVGIVFVMPSGGLIPYSFSLLEICSNNVAKYEALIIALN